MSSTDSAPSFEDHLDEDVEIKDYHFRVRNPSARTRLDVYLAGQFSFYSRTFIKRLTEHDGVAVNGKAVKPSYLIQDGDLIEVKLPSLPREEVRPEDIPLDVIYEDDWILAINKPPDIVVHPARGHQTGTLVNALAYRFERLSEHSGAHRPGVVHRLDRDTSGVMLFVKSEDVHEQIARQFERRRVRKEYVAVAEGRIELDGDVINAPLASHPRQSEKMCVRKSGKRAETVYEVVERLGDFTVVRCFPKTGRTHQIRVHLQHIGHPVVADFLYGVREALYMSDLTGGESPPDEEPLLDRQALHARRLTFYHPVQKREMSFEAPVPDDMMRLIETLRKLSRS